MAKVKQKDLCLIYVKAVNDSYVRLIQIYEPLRGFLHV